MVVRDRAYLDWRFFRRPDATYTMLAATRGADLLGYLVLRRALRDGMPWGYLVDFLVDPESPAVWPMLVREALARFRADGVALVGCLANLPQYSALTPPPRFVPWRGRAGYFHARVDVPTRILESRSTIAHAPHHGDGDFETGSDSRV